MGRSINSEHSISAYEDKSITKQHQVTSPLLHLPAELRNRIYDFVSDLASIEPAFGTQTAQRYRVVLASSRLPLICRQLRHEVSPLQNGFKYHRLSLKMRATDIPDLVDLIGPSQCAEICRIDMYMTLASSIHRTVKKETAEGPYAGPWARFGGGGRTFRSLQRIVVTYPIDLNSDALAISRSLQTMFGNTDLEVSFRPATYW